MKHLCNLFLFIFFVFLLGACTGRGKPVPGTPETKDGDLPDGLTSKNIKLVEQKDYLGNTEKFAIIESTGQKQGKFLRLSPDNKILEEAYYKNGQLDGLRVIYYPENQDTQIVETHLKGQFEGPYRSYYPGNALKLTGNYKDNKIQGIWYKYYESGALKEEVSFEDNLENGPFTEYFENGQISVVGHYLNGDNEHGEIKFYSEEGVHFKTMECDEGLCRTIWKLEDEPL